MCEDIIYTCSKMATVSYKSKGEGMEEEAFIPAESKELSDEEDALLRSSTQPALKQKKKLACFVLLGSILCVSLSVVVVTAVTTLTVLAVYGTGNSASNSNVQKTFTLDQVFNSSLTPGYYHGKWVNQIDALARISGGAVVLYFPHNDTSVTLVPHDKSFHISDFKISPSLKYVLLMTNSEKQYRHSKLAEYYIFNTSSNTADKITTPKTDKLQYVEWSPVSDHLAFTADYTLYVMDVGARGLPVNVADGSKDTDQVGVPDWVYEEEMLESDHAVWWSPDGKKLLYVEFSDISVPMYSFPMYGPEQQQYPEIESIAYPKSGASNPNVTVYASSLDSTRALTLVPPADLTDKEHYIQIGGWVNATHIYLLWLDRPQDKRIFTIYDLSSTQQFTLHPVREIVEISTAWIEVSNNPPPIAVKGTSNLLVIMSSGWKGTANGYLHLASIDFENSAVNFLTAGDWEVTDVVGYNTDGSDVLYISTEAHTWDRHVYSSKSGKCLTCDDSRWNLSRGSLPDVPTTSSVFHAVCSSNLQYCVLHCYGPTLPYSVLVRYEDGQFVQVKVLEANEHVVTAAKDLTVSKVQYFTVPADEDGPDLYGRMILPPYFDSKKKYPVLVHVYGGPGSQMIKNYDVFSQRWELFQTAALNCIIVSVDGRGTGFRGDKFKFDVYRQLGKLETVDQIRAGRYLQSLDYVDGSRLAIYGTSFGGYMAGMVGSSGSGLYKVAISRSPVVDWRYYDSIYTERYMGTPEDNEDGYYNSSVLHRVKNLSSVNFLLIHGTGDDNVHFQNSAQLVRALTVADIQFRVQFYTDKAHSISGSVARRHLYTLIDDFLQSNL